MKKFIRATRSATYDDMGFSEGYEFFCQKAGLGTIFRINKSFEVFQGCKMVQGQQSKLKAQIGPAYKSSDKVLLVEQDAICNILQILGAMKLHQSKELDLNRDLVTGPLSVAIVSHLLAAEWLAP